MVVHVLVTSSRKVVSKMVGHDQCPSTGKGHGRATMPPPGSCCCCQGWEFLFTCSQSCSPGWKCLGSPDQGYCHPPKPWTKTSVLNCARIYKQQSGSQMAMSLKANPSCTNCSFRAFFRSNSKYSVLK